MLEAVLLLTIFAAVGAQRAVRDVLRAAPLGYRVFAVTLAAAMLAGQLTGDGRATYPFVNWAMYSKRIEGDAVYYRLSMIGTGGQEERIPVGRLFPGAGGQLGTHMALLANELAPLPEGPARARVRAALEGTLRAIRERYDGLHPDAPIRELRYARCTVPVQVGSVGAPDCHVVLSIGPGVS